jgi:hypothetical protein
MCESYMDECDDGDYVKYTDVIALIEENARLKSEMLK